VIATASLLPAHLSNQMPLRLTKSPPTRSEERPVKITFPADSARTVIGLPCVPLWSMTMT
jgi:hypothetical protein